MRIHTNICFSIFRLGDGHSGSDSKHSDTMSDQGNIPYDVLLQDLTQAKRQLLELHNLVRHVKFLLFLKNPRCCFLL